ncbi:MAG: thioredoxin domain-containing protein [Nanoarchaeota archaeon]
MAERLIMFTGEECTHCKEMHPLVEQLEKELSIEIVRLEVWHNADNAAFLESIDKNPDGSPFCGGIPLFYNEGTGKKLCGNQKYEKLKAWALGN